jgi:hypothetical protein
MYSVDRHRPVYRMQMGCLDNLIILDASLTRVRTAKDTGTARVLTGKYSSCRWACSGSECDVFNLCVDIGEIRT